MIKPSALLAAVNWLSLIILIWLLVLDVVPLGGLQFSALVFFFTVALVATAYNHESGKVKK